MFSDADLFYQLKSMVVSSPEYCNGVNLYPDKRNQFKQKKFLKK